MRDVARIANIIVLTRDQGAGQVTWVDGQIRVEYQLQPHDAKHMMQGVEKALRIHRAAGALRTIGPHQKPLILEADSDLDTYLKQVKRLGTRGNMLSLYSAHQMSTCRLASDPALGPFDITGQSHEIRNLFIADASGLPTSTGVNPMLSIMTVADLLSQNWEIR